MLKLWIIIEDFIMTYSIHDLDKIDFSDVADPNEPRLAPVHVGEILFEEFLKPLALSKYRLAKDISVSPQRIGDIVAGKRSVTADTDLRLCRYFGVSNGFFLRLQAHYDIEVAQESLVDILAHIKPYHTLTPKHA
jgi:addiction module HigA family antidote